MNDGSKGILKDLREVDVHTGGGVIEPFGNSERLFHGLRAVTLDVFQGITSDEVHEFTGG